MCLVRFALANIRRRPERFVLSVLGIALAIACVTVVRTISASFAITGADSVTDVLGGAQLWAVPAAGVHYDPTPRRWSPTVPRPGSPMPEGWTATRVLSGAHRHRRAFGFAARQRRNTQRASSIGLRLWPNGWASTTVTASSSAARVCGRRRIAATVNR